MPISCIIIGAGLIGRSLSWYLTQAGTRVTLVTDHDPEGSVSSTTQASLGVLTRPAAGDDSFSRFYRASHELHRSVSRQLAEETGVDVGWRPCGGLDLAFDEEQATLLQDRGTRLLARGARGNRLSPGEAAARLPPRAPTPVDAFWWEDDHLIDPAQLARALWIAARRRGARVYRAGVANVVTDPAGVLLSDGERLTADAVVIAAGARSGALMAALGCPPRTVRSIPGQSLRLRTAMKLDHVVHWSDVHMLPASDGSVRIGATVEEEADSANPTESARARLLEAASWLSGGQDLAVVAHEAGLRPKPRRGRPLIAALPQAGFFVASGHYKSGVLMAPLTGLALSRLIIDSDPGIDLDPFCLAR